MGSAHWATGLLTWHTPSIRHSRTCCYHGLCSLGNISLHVADPRAYICVATMVSAQWATLLIKQQLCSISVRNRFSTAGGPVAAAHWTEPKFATTGSPYFGRGAHATGELVQAVSRQRWQWITTSTSQRANGCHKQRMSPACQWQAQSQGP